MRNAIIIGFVLRLVVAVWNGFWGPSFSAEADAAGFHSGAVTYARGEDSTNFALSNIYIYALGTLYRWTFESLFFGSFFSCIAWIASAGLLSRMMDMLTINDANQFRAMLIYALMPSVILLTGITLREAYQLFAVNMIVYAALKTYLYRSYWHILLILLGVVLMGALHVALLVAGFFILAITLLFVFFQPHNSLSFAKFTLTLLVLALLGYQGSTLFLDSIFQTNNMELGAALQARQDSWQQSTRAHYSMGFKINSGLDLLWFVPAALFHYLFQPMIWIASTIIDWGLVLENLLRCVMLFKVVVALFTLPTRRKIPLVLVFFGYLLIETVWAVGTINWGTAARHHIPAFGLLVLAAFAGTQQKNTLR